MRDEPLKSFLDLLLRLGTEGNYSTPKLVARFDETNEFMQFTGFPNEAVAVQGIDRPYELGIIRTRRNYNRNVHQPRGRLDGSGANSSEA